MPGKNKVSLVILASGFSKRFGRNKLLEELDSKPLLLYTIENALAAEHSEIIVVVEPGNNAIKEIIPSDVRVVENPGRISGISSAVKAGLNSVSEDSDAVLFLVGDQPFVSAELIDCITEKFEHENCTIVSCREGGIIKNPMLFSKIYFNELGKVKEDTGAKQVAIKHMDSVCPIDISDPRLLLDIDTEKEMEFAIKTKKELKRSGK